MFLSRDECVVCVPASCVEVRRPFGGRVVAVAAVVVVAADSSWRRQLYRAQRPARKEESGVALPSPYAGASRLRTTVVVAVVAGESKRGGQSRLTAPARRCPEHGLAVAA